MKVTTTSNHCKLDAEFFKYENNASNSMRKVDESGTDRTSIITNSCISKLCIKRQRSSVVRKRLK